MPSLSEGNVLHHRAEGDAGLGWVSRLQLLEHVVDDFILQQVVLETVSVPLGDAHVVLARQPRRLSVQVEHKALRRIERLLLLGLEQRLNLLLYLLATTELRQLETGHSFRESHVE